MEKLRRWHVGLLLALGIVSLVIGACRIADVEMDHRLRVCLAVIQTAVGLGVIYTSVRTLRNRTRGESDEHGNPETSECQ